MPATRSSTPEFYDAAGAGELCFLDITASDELKSQGIPVRL